MSKKLAKRVSNYELFFDLALVLAIGQLTTAIHIENVTGTALIGFVLANITLLNIWNNEVFYYNKYGDSRRIDIYTVIALMFVLGNLALTFDFSSISSQGNSKGFLFHVLLITAYGIIALQFFLKGRILGFTPDIKAHIRNLIIYMGTLLPFTFGWLDVTVWTFWIYLIPALIPLFWQSKEPNSDYRSLNFPHAVERTQLMTILAFGESVIAIIQTYPLAEQPLNGITSFLAMAFLFGFYMSQTFLNINHHSERNATLLFYAHLIIFMGINFFTVGIEFLNNHHHAELGHLIYIIGILLFFSGVLLTATYNQDLYRLTKPAWVRLLVTLVLGLLVLYIIGESIWLLAITTFILATLMSRINMTHRRLVRERHNIAHPDPTQNLRDFS